MTRAAHRPPAHTCGASPPHRPAPHAVHRGRWCRGGLRRSGLAVRVGPGVVLRGPRARGQPARGARGLPAAAGDGAGRPGPLRGRRRARAGRGGADDGGGLVRRARARPARGTGTRAGRRGGARRGGQPGPGRPCGRRADRRQRARRARDRAGGRADHRGREGAPRRAGGRGHRRLRRRDDGGRHRRERGRRAAGRAAGRVVVVARGVGGARRARHRRLDADRAPHPGRRAGPHAAAVAPVAPPGRGRVLPGRDVADVLRLAHLALAVLRGPRLRAGARGPAARRVEHRADPGRALRADARRAAAASGGSGPGSRCCAGWRARSARCSCRCRRSWGRGCGRR